VANFRQSLQNIMKKKNLATVNSMHFLLPQERFQTKNFCRRFNSQGFFHNRAPHHYDATLVVGTKNGAAPALATFYSKNLYRKENF
jgi:hypothetical protein